HARVLERLCGALLDRDDLLRDHGRALFWCAWTALHRARVKGVDWSELQALGERIEALAHRGPDSVTRLRFAALIRLLGLRRAEGLRSLMLGLGNVLDRRVAS